MPSDPPPDWRDFEVEESGTASGHCECCGTATSRVWGLVRRNGEPVGAYFVTWTQDKPDHGARFDLILGKWGDSATKGDRYSVALDYRVFDGVPQLMVVDADRPRDSGEPLAGTSLSRSDVVGTPIAPWVFAIVHAVYMSQSAGEVRCWTEH